MRRARWPVGAKIASHLLLASSDVVEVDRAVEHGPRTLWLIIRHLMASFVDASEGEVAVLSHFAVLLPTPHQWRIAGLSEFLRVLVLQP